MLCIDYMHSYMHVQRVTLCQLTTREVDSMLVHATPREVKQGCAKSTHGPIVRYNSAVARGPVADFRLNANSAFLSACHKNITMCMNFAQ